MADKKITALSALGAIDVAPATDLLHIIDYSAAPVNKKITVANLFSRVDTNISSIGVSTFEIGATTTISGFKVVVPNATPAASEETEVVVNDNSNAYVDFRVESNTSAQAIVVDASADTVTINGDSTILDFVVKGDTTTLIHCDGGLDAVGIGTVTPDTTYTMTVAATGVLGIKSLGSVDITGALSTTTNATIGGAAAGVLFLPSVESVTYASGTANHPSVAVTTSLVTLTTGASSGVLPNGTSVGQIKIITTIAVSGSAVYTNTPATMNGFTSFAINAASDAIILQWQTAGWTIVSNTGCVLA